MKVIAVEAKYRKRNQQWYLLDSALRFYEKKDTEYLKDRVSRVLARLLALDGVLRKRGEPVLSPGEREALLLTYEAFTPASAPELRRSNGEEDQD